MDNNHYIDLWTKQSQMFWQTVYQVPIIAGAMFAGWFALKSASQSLLAEGLLVVGIVSMIIQVLILKRMSQYLNTFRQAADNLIPSVPKASMGLTGYILGIAVPAIIAFFFLILLIWAPEFSKPLVQLSTSTPNKLPPIMATSAVPSTTTPVSVPPTTGKPASYADPVKRPEQ